MIHVGSALSCQRARSTIRTTGCTELLGSATDELLMPATVSAELSYMLETGAGSARRKWRSYDYSQQENWSPSISTPLTTRMAELVEQYAGVPLGELLQASQRPALPQ